MPIFQSFLLCELCDLNVASLVLPMSLLSIVNSFFFCLIQFLILLSVFTVWCVHCFVMLYTSVVTHAVYTVLIQFLIFLFLCVLQYKSRWWAVKKPVNWRPFPDMVKTSNHKMCHKYNNYSEGLGINIIEPRLSLSLIKLIIGHQSSTGDAPIIIATYLVDLTRVRNSSLVRGSSLNTPIIELVTVLFWGLLIPRIVMHMCL